jgi:hypothetical protein
MIIACLFVIPGHALRVDPESSSNLWIPGSLALRNLAQSERSGMTAVMCQGEFGKVRET